MSYRAGQPIVLPDVKELQKQEPKCTAPIAYQALEMYRDGEPVDRIATRMGYPVADIRAGIQWALQVGHQTTGCAIRDHERRSEA